MSTRPKTEWFDDDSFWIDQYPSMFSAQRFADAADQAERLVTLVNPHGREVLDLGCGPGRFAIPLAQKGLRVTGVDRTAFLLEKGRVRADAAQVEVDSVHQDMRDFVRPSTFDLIISMFTSFGYFEDKREDLIVLRNMVRNLKPGGTCVIDVIRQVTRKSVPVTRWRRTSHCTGPGLALHAPAGDRARWMS